MYSLLLYHVALQTEQTLLWLKGHTVSHHPEDLPGCLCQTLQNGVFWHNLVIGLTHVLFKFLIGENQQWCQTKVLAHKRNGISGAGSRGLLLEHPQEWHRGFLQGWCEVDGPWTRPDHSLQFVAPTSMALEPGKKHLQNTTVSAIRRFSCAPVLDNSLVRLWHLFSTD